MADKQVPDAAEAASDKIDVSSVPAASEEGTTDTSDATDIKEKSSAGVTDVTPSGFPKDTAADASANEKGAADPGSQIPAKAEPAAAVEASEALPEAESLAAVPGTTVEKADEKVDVKSPAEGTKLATESADSPAAPVPAIVSPKDSAAEATNSSVEKAPVTGKNNLDDLSTETSPATGKPESQDLSAEKVPASNNLAQDTAAVSAEPERIDAAGANAAQGFGGSDLNEKKSTGQSKHTPEEIVPQKDNDKSSDSAAASADEPEMTTATKESSPAQLSLDNPNTGVKAEEKPSEIDGSTVAKEFEPASAKPVGLSESVLAEKDAKSVVVSDLSKDSSHVPQLQQVKKIDDSQKNDISSSKESKPISPKPTVPNASKPGPPPSPPVSSQPAVDRKPSPSGQAPPFLQNAPSSVKGGTVPWSAPKQPDVPDKRGPVQMVGSHEDTADQVADSSDEYRKQFSDRKKFFKQQMEQSGVIPIKAAPPPGKIELPTSAAEPTPAPVPVVLSQAKVPEALRIPLEPGKEAPEPTAVLRSTGSQYSPAAQAAEAAAAAAAEAEQRRQAEGSSSPFSPPQAGSYTPPGYAPAQLSAPKSPQNLGPGLLADYSSPSSFLSPDNFRAPLGAPTPFTTPEISPHANVAPMWSPQKPISAPSQSGVHGGSTPFSAAPSFDAKQINHSSATGTSFGQQSGPVPYGQSTGPVPYGQQRPPSALPPLHTRTPSPTLQPKPSLALSHNQFSAPQPAGNSYAAPAFAPTQLGAAPAAHAPLPDLTDLIGMGHAGKKKTFADSSFYSDQNELYPTFEEQVKLARDISSSLTSEDNKSSLGARMFTRRQVKSKKWTIEGGHQVNGDQWESGEEGEFETDQHKINGPPPLKYYQSPKGVDDAQSLMQKDPGIKIFDSMSPISLAAVSQGLENTSGRGVDLFQKRKQKAEEWVVDESNVKKAPPPPVVDLTEQNKLKQMLSGQSVLYVKSPWEAALESPIGSCETAFQAVRPGGLAPPAGSNLSSRTPSPHMAAPFQQPAASPSPAPPPTDSFSRLPRGWGPSSVSAPSFAEPARTLQSLVVQSPSPIPFQSPSPAPPMFKPQTPEPTPFFKPQFSPEPITPIHSVYRAAPPAASDYSMLNDNDANVAIDANIPNYQPAPQSVVRRYSQPSVEFGGAKFYPPAQQSPEPQLPPWLSKGPTQSYAYNQQEQSGPPGRHVTWHPETKQADHWTPQSTDEHRRLYNERHQQWDLRPPEPVSYRARPRSRSQPPAPYNPGQQRGYQPSYNAYGTPQSPSPTGGKRWGNDMSNWRVPNAAPSFRPPPQQQSPTRMGSWGADMNQWKPRLAATQQNQPVYHPQQKPAQQSRPGSWGPDMHNWAPPQQSNAPVYRPQQQAKPTGTWGSDMRNWRPQAAEPAQQTVRFSSQQQPAPQSGQWGNTGAPQRPRFPGPQLKAYTPPQQQQQQQQWAQPQQQASYGQQPPQYQQGYATMPARQSRQGGGILISDM